MGEPVRQRARELLNTEEYGSAVCRTEESERIAPFAPIEVCAGAVLPGRRRTRTSSDWGGDSSASARTAGDRSRVEIESNELCSPLPRQRSIPITQFLNSHHILHQLCTGISYCTPQNERGCHLAAHCSDSVTMRMGVLRNQGSVAKSIAPRAWEFPESSL